MVTITVQQLSQMVGQSLGSSDWFLIDQQRVDKFAEATSDTQFIHVNEELAKQTPFGGTIAHGFLTLSLFPVLFEQSNCPQLDGVLMGLNYGGNRVRFLSPIRVGKRIRGHFRLIELSEKRPHEWLQSIEFTVEVEGEDKPALIAEWMGMLYTQSGA